MHKCTPQRWGVDKCLVDSMERRIFRLFTIGLGREGQKTTLVKPEFLDVCYF